MSQTPGDEALEPDELKALFNFDAFAPENEPEPAKVDESPEPEAPAVEAEAVVGEQPAAVEAPAPETPAPVVEAPEVSLLRRTVDEQRQQIQELMAIQREALTQRGQHPAHGPGQAPQPAAQAPEYPYNFQLPDQLVSMMESEDPTQRRAGYNALTTGLARTIHAEIRKEFEPKLENFRKELPRTVETMHEQRSQAQAESQRVFTDFYGKYPELNRAELQPLVVSTASRIMQNLGTNQWSPELRDQVGTQVRAILRASTGLAAAPAAQGVGNGSRPPKQRDTSTRPPAGPGGVQGEIDDLLFGDF